MSELEIEKQYIYYESETTDYWEYENNNGEVVKIKFRSIQNSGRPFYYFGPLFIERTTMECTVTKIINGITRKRQFIWPSVQKILVDEKNNTLLFEDYVIIEKPDKEFDENSLVVSIYYYVNWNGQVLTDAYCPVFDLYYPLDKLKEYDIFYDNNDNFANLYRREIKRIGLYLKKIIQSRNSKTNTEFNSKLVQQLKNNG